MIRLIKQRKPNAPQLLSNKGTIEKVEAGLIINFPSGDGRKPDYKVLIDKDEDVKELDNKLNHNLYMDEINQLEKDKEELEEKNKQLDADIEKMHHEKLKLEKALTFIGAIASSGNCSTSLLEEINFNKE